jgi:hypothetical protein
MKYKNLFRFLFIFYVWILNLEFNPSLGGILLRPNINGDLVLVFNNVINMIKQIFINLDFWKINMFDVNIVIFSFLFYLIFFFQ